MPTTLTFNYPINTSVQVGDIAYYIQTNAVGGYNIADTTNLHEIGVITQVFNDNPYYIVCDGSNPPQGSFIMFAKDSIANTAGVKGYYAEIEMKNTQSNIEEVELFVVSSEISESSK